MTTSQQRMAERFHELHSGEILVLPNAWDAASARLVEDAGARAVATTSAGVAWSLGTPDGNRLGRDLAVEAVARIAAAVQIPVTADIESGYADDPDGVAETVRRVVEAGAVGINLEDGLLLDRPVQEAAQRVAAARRAADECGVRLFVNARTDVFLRQFGDPADRLDATLRRAAAYREAGADGVFVPGIGDGPTIAKIADGVPVPLNVIARPGMPSLAELAELGVARVTFAGTLAVAAYATAWSLARQVLDTGAYPAVPPGFEAPNLNALLNRD